MADHATQAHHPALQHHFEDMGQQHESGTLGMWLFLVTEVMFFGPLFFAYALFRFGWLGPGWTEAWIAASHHQSIKLGLTNTIVLILSSLTVAMGVYFSQTNKKNMLVLMLVLTLILGATFLGIKAVEYYDHWEHHLVPGAGFQFHDAPGLEKQAEMFFFVYFCMTGLHAFHMIIGIGIFIWLLRRAMRGDFSSEYYVPVEVGGLYWHFVDIVWIFLFPLLYLIDPALKH
jgi:cytochrome c oxidase subunit III